MTKLCDAVKTVHSKTGLNLEICLSAFESRTTDGEGVKVSRPDIIR
jgi:hypothetical protein